MPRELATLSPTAWIARAREVSRLAREHDEQIVAMDEEWKRHAAFIPGDPRE